MSQRVNPELFDQNQLGKCSDVMRACHRPGLRREHSLRLIGFYSTERGLDKSFSFLNEDIRGGRMPAPAIGFVGDQTVVQVGN